MQDHQCLLTIDLQLKLDGGQLSLSLEIIEYMPLLLLQCNRKQGTLYVGVSMGGSLSAFYKRCAAQYREDEFHLKYSKKL